MSLYHYSGCSTCKKAIKWLDARGLAYVRVDLTQDTPTPTRLADLHARSGLAVRKFLNTSGNSYRNGGFKERLPQMSDREAYAALAADGMLIKRPILDTGSSVLVGFNEAAWQAALSD